MSTSHRHWNDTRGFARFVVVGGTCFLAGMAVVWLLTERAGWHYLVSTAAATLAANALGWLFNRSWTYRVHRARGTAEFVRYLGVNLAGMAVSLGAVAVLVDGLAMPYLAACALVAILMALVNFQLHGRVSLRAGAADG